MFNWQTDENEEWLEQPAGSASTGGWRAFGRRLLGRWQTAVFLLLILCISGAVVWLDHRADAALAAAEQDVLLTHQLIEQAALTGDNELFTAMLHPEGDWPLLQQQLIADDLFFNRGVMGLWHNGEPHEHIVTLSPDLTQAEITAALPYFTQDGVRVMLAKTNSYQHNGSGWQLAPLEAEFWGDWQQADRFPLRYRQQDESIARELAADLAQTVTDLCAIAACPADFPPPITLSDDPHSLLPFRTHYRAVTLGEDGFVLPSPTLVGVPTDAAGYAALRDGYAGWMAAVFLHELERIDPPSQPHNPAIILEKLGLTLPPITRQPIAPPAQTVIMQCGENLWAYDREWTAVLSNISGALHSTTLGEPFFLSSSANRSIVYGWDDGFAPILRETGRLVPLTPSRYPQLAAQWTAAQSAVGKWTDGSAWHDSASPLVWSPDGRYTLLILDGMIWLGDGTGRPLQRIENGRLPFWINHASYGYLRENGDIVQLTLADSVLPEQMEPTITPAELLAELPEEKRPEQLVLEGITAVSANRWFIESNAGMVVFNPQTAVAEAVVFVDGGVVGKNGRFLAHHADGAVQLYDLQEGEVNSHATLAQVDVQLQWSADGEWLLVADDELLHLIEAQTGEEVVIEHGMMGCKTAVFVEE